LSRRGYERVWVVQVCTLGGVSVVSFVFLWPSTTFAFFSFHT
jgi:hypothetical protein